MRPSTSSFLRWLVVLCFFLGTGTGQGQTLQYGLTSDNFQGQSSLPAGYVASGPSYQNNPDTIGLPNLKAFAANSANINATVTVPNLNFTAQSGGGQPYGLCDTTTAAGKAATACANGKGWQGRVMYALLKFPAAGSYYFTLAHDDGAEIDLSGQLTISDPRTATYSTVLGGLASFTTNDTTYVPLNAAPFVVSASACYLMRVYWNNQGGVNHFRLRYGTQSNLSDQAIVPDTQFLLPGVAANWQSCTNPTLTVLKTSVGDVGSFTFSGSNGYSSETISTTAPGTPVSGTTFSLTNLNAATTVTETGPGTFALTGATCTDANAARSGNPSSIPSTLSGNTLTIPPAYVVAQAQIQCSLTNTKLGTPSISKSSNGPWIVGQSGATYTLIARNNNSAGGSPTTGTTTIRDALPAGVTANWTGTLTTGGFACTFAGQNVTCTSSASLAPGASTTLILPVNVVSGGGTTVTNFASIGGGGNPANGGTAPTPGLGCTTAGLCTSTDTALLAQPSISKAFSPATVLLSDTSTLSFTLTNSNATPLSNLNFRDTLSNMKVASTTLGGTCANSGIVSNSPALSVGATALNLTVPTLAASSSCTVTVLIQPTATGTLPNTTSGVTSTQTPTAGAVSNTATLTVTPSADLNVVKTGPSTAVAGTTISYLLTLSNAGPSPANGASFADNMPNGLTGVTATCQNAAGGVTGCSAAVGGGNNVIGSVATFPAGGSVQLQISGTVPPGATASLSNLATIKAPSGTTDPTDPGNTGAGNNTSATVTTLLTKQADLSVTKTDGVVNVSSGQTVTYTIVVANAGPSTTTGSFQDTTFSGVTLSGWTCTGTTGTALCPGVALPASGGYSNSLLNLPANSSVTFQVTGTVTATSGNVVNTATVTAPGAVANAAGTLAATSSATDTDTILADLSLSKTGAAAARPGSLVTYTLSVSNAGPSAASGVALSDALPAGTTFSAADQATGFSGTYNGSGTPQTVSWALGTLAAGSTQTVTLVLRMPAEATVRGDSGTPGIVSVTNSASVSSPGDSVAGNNTASATTQLVLVELLKRVRNVSADIRENGGAARFGTTGQGLPNEVLEYCLTFRNLGGVAVAGFSLTDNVPSNVLAQTSAYGSPDLGISLLRGGSGTAGSAGVSGGSLATLTSSPDTDGGALSTSGGSFGQGVMTAALNTPLAVAESGQACFRASIR